MKGKVAAVIFLNEENELLLYLRDDKPSIPYPNSWALIGGHIEKNETILEALKREVKEEIDFEIKNPSYIDLFDDGAENEVYIYKSRINEKIENMELKEGQKLGYFSFEEAIKLKIPEPFKEFLIKNKEKILNDN